MDDDRINKLRGIDQGNFRMLTATPTTHTTRSNQYCLYTKAPREKIYHHRPCRAPKTPDSLCRTSFFFFLSLGSESSKKKKFFFLCFPIPGWKMAGAKVCERGRERERERERERGVAGASALRAGYRGGGSLPDCHAHAGRSVSAKKEAWAWTPWNWAADRRTNDGAKPTKCEPAETCRMLLLCVPRSPLVCRGPRKARVVRTRLVLHSSALAQP
ncbi:hypothetical protein BKA81DRAFT_34273 [Phyllosticta paracitricarpa]